MSGSTVAGVAQLVERQPSKLNVAGSSPVARFATARVAQLVERILGKDEVSGSIPLASSGMSRQPSAVSVQSLMARGASRATPLDPTDADGRWLMADG